MPPENLICQKCPISLTYDPQLQPESKHGTRLPFKRPIITFIFCRHYACDLPGGGLWAAQDALNTGKFQNYRVQTTTEVQIIQAVQFGTSQKPAGRIVDVDGNIYSSANLTGFTYYPTGQQIIPTSF